jgi:hypothetical protein
MPREATKAAKQEDADQDALDGLDACRVGFLGMSADDIGTPPKLDEVAVFKVTAVCCDEPARKRLKAGDIRVVCKMRVEKVELVEGPKKPDNGPDLFSGDEKGDGE